MVYAKDVECITNNKMKAFQMPKSAIEEVKCMQGSCYNDLESSSLTILQEMIQKFCKT